MMDLPEVKAFNAELSGLYDNKPPISKAKMSAITKGAIKAIKVYKHVVHSVEKFIQKCKPEYKVPGLYVIDSIVRQSRHQFGQDKDVFAPRFAKNMQQTFANLFRCPPEDKRNIIRVLNLWQKNNVFSPQVIQPLMDMADPSHPLHQEIQQQNNTANGSSLNISHNTDKSSPGASQHSPPMSSPMGGDQFQDEPSGQSNKFRKLLNDFEYDSEDEPMTDAAPPHSHSHSTSHTSHSTSHTSHAPSHTSHATSHTTHTSQSHGQMQPQPPLPSQNTADAMASILTNPEIMRQLHSLQAQMQMMTGMQLPNLMPMMTDVSQMQQNPNQQNLPFLSSQQEQKDGKEDGGNNESDIEFVDAGPTVIEIPDANDSRSPSPKSRRHRSRSKSPKRRRRGSRSRSRSPRRRRDRERDRDRDRDRDKDRDKDREKNYKEREAEREKQREREKKGLPPIKKDNLSVCSTTLWVGHLSKLATPEELSDLFGAVGGVQHIDVVAPRGCAFVVMERRRDAYKAKQKLNKHKLHSKEITVAWAPGKGVKGREWKDYWEAELGVSYLPWHELHAQWSMGALSLDAIEDGGVCDEETLPPWLPPRILPKSMLDNMSMMGVGMLPLPPGMPPRPAPDMSGGAMSSPLAGGALGMPPAAGGMPAMPPLPNMAMQRMPPPGMGAGLPPGMAAGMPPGIRPAMPAGVPGLGGEGGLPNTMLRFPPGMPPQSMGQTGMVGGFLGGLLGVGGMLGGVPVLHLPPSLHAPQQQQRAAEQNPADDAMDLDTEDHTDDNHTNTNDIVAPPSLLPDQIQALLSLPPPKFNASEPPPGFNASEPPPFAPAPPADDKLDEDRKERDRRDRDRGERRDRDRDRRDRDREQRRDRERPDRNERGPRGDRDRDGGRDDRRERGGRRDRDRDRDRERDRFGNNRDANRSSREKSPRAASSADAPEKSLQERLWEMANGKTASNGPRPDDKSEPERERGRASSERPLDGPQDNDGDDASSSGGWQAAAAGPRPPLLGPPFRPELRMRGPPRLPMSGPPGPWMEGPPGPGGPGGPFGSRFNGMGPPSFNRPPFERPPFDGPRFDGPPRFERPPFNRMPFDMNRPPFDGARPPFDGPRPPFDGPRPPFDGPRPPFDGPRPMFDGPRPPFDGPRPPFDGPPGRQFDGDRPFDGPPEFFDRNNRRFDDREQFNERGWDRRDRPDWDRRERRSRESDERFNRRDERGDRAERPPARRGADDRPRAERQRDDRARDDRARDDKTRDDKPRDDRNRDDRPRDDRPRDDKKEDRPRDDRPKDDKPKEDRPREERRRDKDRKSRWGAAEDTVVEEPQPIETQPADNMETNESNTHLEAPAAIDTLPAEMNDLSDRAESGKGELNEHSESTESRIDDDTKVDIDEPRLEETRFESREKSPQVTENSDRYEETKEEQSHEREESNYEPENKESFEEPAPQSAPVSDLYDADEAIDTSFGAARSETIEAPSKQIEPPNESHDIPKEVFETSKEDFEAPGIPDTPKGVTSPPLDSALAASEDIFSETRETSEAKETSEVREASEAKEASEPVPDAKEGAA